LLGTTHSAAAELARTLVEIAPTGLTHVFFSDNGATAVESALKIAFQYRLLTQGKEAAQHAVYLSLDNAYHGDTLGAAAVGGVELFHDIFKPILLPALKTPSPYCYRCPRRQDAEGLLDRLRRRARTDASARERQRVRGHSRAWRAGQRRACW
jgi:adenosylmethionine-8-amino-7-oxononanoate aminotransferase